MLIVNQIRDLFEQYREYRGGPFEDHDFMQYLLAKDGESLNNTFKGKRYKNRFIDALQTEHSICFPDSALDKRWNFSDFCTYVEERKKKHAANLRMAQKRLYAAKRAFITPFILLNAPGSFFVTHDLATRPYIMASLLVCLNALLVFFFAKELQYYKKLITILEKKCPS